MKIKFIFLSLLTIGLTQAKTVNGKAAETLMRALHQAGVPLQSSQGDNFFKTKKVKNILCFGHRENIYTGGVLNSVKCHYNVSSINLPAELNGIPLEDSKYLEDALIEAGAESDAAMGRWWTWTESLQCLYNQKKGYICNFK